MAKNISINNISIGGRCGNITTINGMTIRANGNIIVNNGTLIVSPGTTYDISGTGSIRVASSLDECSADMSGIDESAPTHREFEIKHDFVGLDNDIAADIYVTIGDEFKVTADGPAHILKHIKMDVDDKMLYITSTLPAFHGDGVKIYITAPSICSCVNRGSGDIDILSDIDAEDTFFAIIGGSGNMRIGNLNAPDLSLKVSGSGNIKANVVHISSDSVIKCSGSGNIKIAELVSNNTSVEVSGSGNVDIASGSTLHIDAKVSGAGRIKASEFLSDTGSARLSGIGNIDLNVKNTFATRQTGVGTIRNHR